MLIYLVILFVLACLGALLVIPVVRILENRPILLLWVLVLIFVASSLFDSGLLPAVNLGGISINAIDVVAPILLCLAFPFVFFRLRDGFGRKDVVLLILLLWSSAVGLNYILGVREFGLQAATNEFRGYFYIICTATYVASLNIARVWMNVEKLFLFGVSCLTVIAIIGFMDGDFSRGGGRPIDAAHTLFILQVLLIAIFIHSRGDLHPYSIPFLVTLFPLLIVLQHRSVWVVMITSFALVLWLLPSLRSALIKWGVIGTVVFGGLCTVLFGATIFEALSDSYEEAVSSSLDTSAGAGTSTFSWRVQGWIGLLTGEQMDSVREVLIGNPFGTGYDRITLTSDGVPVARTESPHNFYVQTLLRGGALGLLALIALYGILFRGLLQHAKKDEAAHPILLCMAVIIASQLVYYLVYGSDYIQAIFLGSAIAWLRDSDTVNANI